MLLFVLVVSGPAMAVSPSAKTCVTSFQKSGTTLQSVMTNLTNYNIPFQQIDNITIVIFLSSTDKVIVTDNGDSTLTVCEEGGEAQLLSRRLPQENKKHT